MNVQREQTHGPVFFFLLVFGFVFGFLARSSSVFGHNFILCVICLVWWLWSVIDLSRFLDLNSARGTLILAGKNEKTHTRSECESQLGDAIEATIVWAGLS